MSRDHKIYMYTNKVNNKVYIGRTCQSLEKRAGANGCAYRSSHRFWNAITKYGWESFIPCILEDGLTDEEASIKELEYISKYNSSGDAGYNIVDSIKSNYGDGKRRSLSEAISRSMTSEHRAHLSKMHTGKKMSEESRIKMSIAKTGVKRGPRSEETKEKIRQAHLGKCPTEETRKRQSLARMGKEPWNKGMQMPDEFRRKCREANIGKTIPEDVRQKISNALKGLKVGAKNPMSKKVLCIETGEIYNTIAEAVAAAGVSRSKFSKCINNGDILSGYHWEIFNSTKTE